MIPCPICRDFEPADDEEFKQHLEWVHIAPRDFGDEDSAVPNLLHMMMGGWITPDQMTLFVQEIVEVSFRRTWRPWNVDENVRELLLGLMMGFAWGGLVAIWSRSALTAVFVGINLVIGYRLVRIALRGRSIRFWRKSAET